MLDCCFKDYKNFSNGADQSAFIKLGEIYNYVTKKNFVN